MIQNNSQPPHSQQEQEALVQDNMAQKASTDSFRLKGQQRTSLRALDAYTYSKFYVGYCAACIRLLHKEDVRWVFIVDVNQLICVKWGITVIQKEPSEMIVCKGHTTGNSIIRNA